jgi:hypothetical protein
MTAEFSIPSSFMIISIFICQPSQTTLRATQQLETKFSCQLLDSASTHISCLFAQPPPFPSVMAARGAQPCGWAETGHHLLKKCDLVSRSWFSGGRIFFALYCSSPPLGYGMCLSPLFLSLAVYYPHIP